MVGRNQPCPCGSGKKYKKCHGAVDQATIGLLIAQELEQVISLFFTTHPKPEDVRANAGLFTEWERRLSPYYDRETIHSQAIEYLYLINQPAAWQTHVASAGMKSERPAVRRTLSKWASPLTLFAVVESVSDGTAVIRDVLEDGTYKWAVPEDMEVEKGEAVFGHFLPDGREEDTILLMNSLAFVEPGHDEVSAQASRLRKLKKHLDSQKFLDRYMLDLYELIGHGEAVAEPETAETAAVSEETDEDPILGLVGRYLVENRIESAELEEKTERFLEEVNPKARKPESVAAGAIRFGQMTGLLSGFEMARTKLAEQFDVSPSTVQKYADDMMKFHKAEAVN
ncbi:YecA family protein [Bhargavaea cecembensis]|uniref:YecA family protein n=1 Tax=Bhargavaea cecembensis TaxID=394098 RepID=UPI00058BF7DE|nr:SEC-C domain-containing protein [Bhargavaea cecembensis]